MSQAGQGYPQGFKIHRSTGLKATTYTTILNVKGQGRLLGISAKDFDDAAQNETIRISIDDNIILTIVADITGAFSYLYLLLAVLKGAGVTWDTFTAADRMVAQRGFAFRNRLKVEYLRAAAQTNGLAINVAYEITQTGWTTTE